jgi:hypothetical protein
MLLCGFGLVTVGSISSKFRVIDRFEKSGMSDIHDLHAGNAYPPLTDLVTVPDDSGLVGFVW